MSVIKSLQADAFSSAVGNRHALARGRHRKPGLIRKIGAEHGRRLASFSVIGFGVFAAGLVVQMFLVEVLSVPKVPAYVFQLILSVQVNFLANYRWTWGDRDAPFWRSCWRYNVKRLAGVLVNLVLYPVLIHMGMNYLIANTALVIALTPVNYVLGHFWTFAAGGRPGSQDTTEAEDRLPQLEYRLQGQPELIN